ncbi:MAG TPA: A24 family peptidase [Bryobacteraceae bacterium]
MPLAIVILLLVLALAAGWFDLRFRRIPNWLNLSGAILGIGLNALLAGGSGGVDSLFGILCAFAVYVPLFLLRAMGAGDVKLMIAIGAIAGPRNWFEIFLASALLGGVVALALAVVKRRLRQTCGNTGTILLALSHGMLPFHADPKLDVQNAESLRMPHGTVIAGGVLIFLALPLVHLS